MAKMTISINDELEHKFRIKISEKGYKKGAISETISKLIQVYLKDE